jgi:hypothetical protein
MIYFVFVVIRRYIFVTKLQCSIHWITNSKISTTYLRLILWEREFSMDSVSNFFKQKSFGNVLFHKVIMFIIIKRIPFVVVLITAHKTPTSPLKTFPCFSPWKMKKTTKFWVQIPQDNYNCHHATMFYIFWTRFFFSSLFSSLFFHLKYYEFLTEVICCFSCISFALGLYFWTFYFV